MPCPVKSSRPDSIIESKRRKHSKKPDEVYSIIERMYPTLNKFELFARREREGVEKLGNIFL
jgi:N6-adenosine-specific RNA methylase IME4